jgi:hypothetical protein
MGALTLSRMVSFIMRWTWYRCELVYRRYQLKVWVPTTKSILCNFLVAVNAASQGSQYTTVYMMPQKHSTSSERQVGDAEAQKFRPIAWNVDVCFVFIDRRKIVLHTGIPSTQMSHVQFLCLASVMRS